MSKSAGKIDRKAQSEALKKKLATMSDDEKRVFMQQHRAERWVKLVQVRVTRALKALQSVGALGSKKKYAYTGEQVAKVFTALNTELKAAADRFNATSDDKAGFKL